ncbi:MAG: hypothetical protein JW798_09685 [Prolixibacteraceae bacterium]|nr:hypothetical protein [Prolixibacteraceae bacterium]
MTNFSSHYNATIDDKGRVVMPSAYKKHIIGDIDKHVFVEVDPYEKCLNIYPPSLWEQRINQLKSALNFNNKAHSLLLDKFYQNFDKVTMADNGRLNIPNLFYKKVGIEKDVVFSGQGDRIRLWDADNFSKTIMSDEDYSKLFGEILGGSS